MTYPNRYALYKSAGLVDQIVDFLQTYWPHILGTLAGAGVGGAAGYYLAPEGRKGLGAGIGAAAGGGLGYMYGPGLIRSVFPHPDVRAELEWKEQIGVSDAATRLAKNNRNLSPDEVADIVLKQEKLRYLDPELARHTARTRAQQVREGKIK